MNANKQIRNWKLTMSRNRVVGTNLVTKMFFSGTLVEFNSFLLS